MKNTILLVAAAVLAVGCDRQRQTASNDISSEKKTIRESAREAKNEVEKEAKAQKDWVNAEAKAAQAQIDAEKARAKAAATDAHPKVEAASQNIREAAGAANEKVQREVGTDKSTPPPAPPPVEPSQPAVAPATPTPAATAEDADQKLVEQVRSVVGDGSEANANLAKNLQITAKGGTVTVKGNVKNEADKTRIESAAKAVPGVSQVIVLLEVQE
jgi:hypothetical protein